MNETTTEVSSTTQRKMVVPDEKSELGKKEQVKQMFDNISFRYDFLNRFLSLGIDILWRKRAIKSLKPFQPKLILDVATGTGDLAIEALKLNPDKIIGVDISEGMLAMGRKKLEALKENRIELQTGDSENLDFENNTFDAATVAFAARIKTWSPNSHT
jgi:demethylmenaquinone methyltransferase/2-methoxy-6-polyprenyl-1,4-benzoquinol methylase